MKFGWLCFLPALCLGGGYASAQVSGAPEIYTLVDLSKDYDPFFACYEPLAAADPLLKTPIGEEIDKEKIGTKPIRECGALLHAAMKTVEQSGKAASQNLDWTDISQRYFLSRLYGFYISRGALNSTEYHRFSKIAECVETTFLADSHQPAGATLQALLTSRIETCSVSNPPAERSKSADQSKIEAGLSHFQKEFIDHDMWLMFEALKIPTGPKHGW